MHHPIPHLDLDTLDLRTAQGWTLVDFYADWCGPCRALAPALDALAEELESQGVRVAKVDVDAVPDLAIRFDVASIPTLLILKDGEVAGRQVGAPSPARLREWIGEVRSA